ncbi:MAG: HD-GYP domain-containing protein [bacterium]
MSSGSRRQSGLFYLVYGLSLVAGVLMLGYLFWYHLPREIGHLETAEALLHGNFWSVIQTSDIDWLALALFFLFLVFADTKLTAGVVGGGKVHSSKSIVLSLIALFGPATAACMEALSSLVRGFVLRNMEPRKALFNASMLAFSAGAAGLVYQALPWSEQFSGPGFLFPLLAALFVHSVVNTLMIAIIMSLDAKVPIQQVYRRNFKSTGMERYLDAPFAAIVILLFLQAGSWTLLIYLFMIMVINRSFKLYQRMREAHINSIAALTTALEADEPYTHGHSYRVSKYAIQVGRAMGLPDRDLEVLEYGGLLHDIGKIAISNDIICKPGRLTDDEFSTVKTHPTIGADIVEQISFLHEASDLVRHHHERPDGKGYPHGLRREEISTGCHILNACDAFDAMTSDRPYRPAFTLEKAIEELVRFRDTQFDPRVVDTVLKLYRKGEFRIIDTLEGLNLEIRVR